MERDSIHLAAKIEALEQEIEKLRAALERRSREAREAEERARKYEACIRGLRHTIDVCQEAIFGQAVAISMMMEEEPVER